MEKTLVLGDQVQGHMGARCSYRPGGGLGGAGLLERHVKAVWARVVGVGGDGGRRREGVEGGAGLCVGRGRRDAILGVVCVVGTGGRGAVLDLLVHAVQEPQVRVLWLRDTQKPPHVSHLSCRSLLPKRHHLVSAFYRVPPHVRNTSHSRENDRFVMHSSKLQEKPQVCVCFVMTCTVHRASWATFGDCSLPESI